MRQNARVQNMIGAFFFKEMSDKIHDRKQKKIRRCVKGK